MSKMPGSFFKTWHLHTHTCTKILKEFSKPHSSQPKFETQRNMCLLYIHKNNNVNEVTDCLFQGRHGLL